MDLIIFAHKGEAQEFIKQLAARPLNDKANLYQSQAGLILITGEGIYEVFSQLGPILGAYEIKRVLNFGIAASLDPQSAALGDMIEARTCYAYDGESPLFHSYTSEGALDIITSSKRVLTSEFADRLSHFAPVADREAWAIAKICHDHKVPYHIHKLISDFPKENVACFDIKSRALEYSQGLFREFKNIYMQKEKAPATLEEAPLPMPMTFSQKARFKKLGLSLKLIDFDMENFSENFGREHLGQKSRAEEFLDELELVLSPNKAETKRRFNDLTSPFMEIGARVIFDKAYEKKKFLLQMEINDQKNILNLKEALDKVQFEDFKKVWDGEGV